MEIQTLEVNMRVKSGKGGSRQVRREGKIPAVLYGLEADPVQIKIDAREFEYLVHGKQGERAIVQLDIEDQPDLSGPAILKEVQHHPVRGHIIHADLMRIDLTKKITTHIPVKIVGRSKGVIEGGMIDHQTREIEVSCVATNVPEAIEFDVTELDIGDSVHVSDLSIPEGVDLITSLDRTVAAVHAPRVVVEEEVEVEEGVEGVEGEEGAESSEGDGEGGEESKRD